MLYSNDISTFSFDIPPQIDLNSKPDVSLSSPGKSPTKMSNTYHKLYEQ